MFAVVEYFNYRKDVTFKILHVYHKYNCASIAASEYARKKYGDDNVVEYVEESHVHVHGEREVNTAGDGYGKDVYGVIEIPDPVFCDDDCKCKSWTPKNY